MTEAVQTWFLAQLKPNSHAIADRNLTRQGFDTFVPFATQTTRRGGQFKSSVKPLFPGYIFVSFDVQKGQWRSINATQGVTKLVSFGDRPAEVPMMLVSELRARCDSDGVILPVNEGLRPGDKVEVSNGPFAGFVATVETLAPDKRVWLLLDMLGRATKISAAPKDLRAL